MFGSPLRARRIRFDILRPRDPNVLNAARQRVAGENENLNLRGGDIRRTRYKEADPYQQELLPTMYATSHAGMMRAGEQMRNTVTARGR